MKVRRAYRMTARAEAAAETGARIVEVAKGLFLANDYEDVTLQAIAEGAEVTLQTVLRRFGSKEGLVEAIAERWKEQILSARRVTRPGDVGEAVRVLVSSYEEMGPMNWRMLRQEHRISIIHDRLEEGRRAHRAWLEETFARWLPRRGKARERMVLRLFAATDVYVWKLLRIDLGLPREEVEHSMRDTVTAITGEERR